jgi:hypothetical protein
MNFRNRLDENLRYRLRSRKDVPLKPGAMKPDMHIFARWKV